MLVANVKKINWEKYLVFLFTIPIIIGIISLPIEQTIGFVSFIGILLITIIIGFKNPSIKEILLLAFFYKAYFSLSSILSFTFAWLLQRTQ